MGAALALATGIMGAGSLYGQGPSDWRAPSSAAVRVSVEGKITNSTGEEYELTSSQEWKAKPGDAFEMKVGIRVDMRTQALPELACYDAAAREIPARSWLATGYDSVGRVSPGRSSLATGPGALPLEWMDYERIFPVQPGTASVRARIRGAGRGVTEVANLVFRPVQVDAYQTGALVWPPFPTVRHGVLLESNLGIVNEQLISEEDRDGDGKWAIIRVDLDKLAKLDQLARDWRTCMEYKPNLIYWSDGVVLKSDTVKEDRAPDITRALHWRMKIHPGPYRATLSDPGRAVAVSLDGKSWKRYEGGREADLGVLPMKDGVIELWMDACYRDPVSVGPVYFDYVRVMPEDDPAADERIFQAARRKPVGTVRGTAEEKRVAVTVKAPQFSGGANWPVRCGIPIPQGELATAENASVLDARGRPVPSQNRVQATWLDGSVKWLYLDFQHDFSKSGEGQYTIAYGTKVRQAAPGTVQVKVSQVADGLEVDTGAIRFTVPRAKFGLVRNVRAADGRVLQADPLATQITEASGKVWPVPDVELEVEQPGPLHAVIVVKAPGYGARIHAYAGSPLVQIDHFIANIDKRATVQVKSIVLKVPAPGTETGAQIAVKADAKAAGWASTGAMGVGVEAFREQYPKALRWSPQGVNLDLWAPEGGEYMWYQGTGKTHHISLYYAKPAGDGALLANGPVLALATPEWYTGSGAFGPIQPAARGTLPIVEKALAQHITDKLVRDVGLGYENYGDFWTPSYVFGSYMWIDNEYDVPAAALLHFVRSGNTDALRVGLASVRHFVDVDCIHFSNRPELIGGPHSHSHDETGHHTADMPNMSHAGVVAGIIYGSYLTGDPSLIEGAKGIAEWALRNLSPQSNTGGMERQSGHPMMTLNDMYEVTWDDRYLRGSAKLVDWDMRWEHPIHGGFLAPIPEHAMYHGDSGYSSGLISQSLLKFNSWAHLPEVDAMLERYARHMLTFPWQPPDGILDKTAAAAGVGPLHISSHLQLMRAEYLRTGDPLFLALPLEMVKAAFERPDGYLFREVPPPYDPDDIFGLRSSGLVFKSVPWFLALVQEQGNPHAGGVEVHPVRETVEIPKGGTVPVCFAVKNVTGSPIQELRMSFQPRLDFSVARSPAALGALEPGQTAEACYDVKAPEKINTALQLERISYSHWDATFRSEGQPGVAHAWARITVQ
jgi:hypothetical protein